MAINYVDGKYVDEKGFVKLDPTVYGNVARGVSCVGEFR